MRTAYIFSTILAIRRWDKKLHHIINNSMANNRNEKPVPWGKSDAKFNLREDIIGGNVTKDMTPNEVYNMRPEYKDYSYQNFRTNLRSLRKTVKDHLGRAELDKEFYLHDKHLFQGVTNCELWHRSEAYKLLKNDVKECKVEGTKPKELYKSKVEYQTFPLKKFRNQIYHEQTRLRKKKMIELGTHPRFGRLKRHDPRKCKIQSTEVLK